MEKMSGVLALTRAAKLHAYYKGRLEASGFQDVTVTDKGNEALDTVICNKKPRLVMIDSWFYQDATSFRIGELVKLFPKLNIAVFPSPTSPQAALRISSWKAQIHTLARGKGMRSYSVACGLCGREIIK
jgi:hypothetical protein